VLDGIFTLFVNNFIRSYSEFNQKFSPRARVGKWVGWMGSERLACAQGCPRLSAEGTWPSWWAAATLFPSQNSLGLWWTETNIYKLQFFLHSYFDNFCYFCSYNFFKLTHTSGIAGIFIKINNKSTLCSFYTLTYCWRIRNPKTKT
jgi:hypothetical protein